MRTCTFQMLSVFVTSLISLSFLSGCSTTLSSTQNDSSVVQADGGSGDSESDVGSNDGSNDVQSSQPDGNVEKMDSIPSGTTLSYLTLNAKTPDGKTAMFYVCGSNCVTDIKTDLDKKASFKDEGTEFAYSVIKFSSGRHFEIHVYRENFLFVPWFVKIEDTILSAKQNTSVFYEWTAVGSWCFTVNGTYLDSSDKEKKNATTSVKNGKCTLTIGTYDAVITDHALTPTDTSKPDGIQVTGTISEDGSIINYHWIYHTNSGDDTLTRQ